MSKPRSRLGRMIQLYCASQGISERELARQLSMDKATFNRVMHAHEINLGHFMPLLEWLLEAPRPAGKESFDSFKQFDVNA